MTVSINEVLSRKICLERSVFHEVPVKPKLLPKNGLGKIKQFSQKSTSYPNSYFPTEIYKDVVGGWVAMSGHCWWIFWVIRLQRLLWQGTQKDWPGSPAWQISIMGWAQASAGGSCWRLPSLFSAILPNKAGAHIEAWKPQQFSAHLAAGWWCLEWMWRETAS